MPAIDRRGGGWEYPASLFMLCIAHALLGDGLVALSPSAKLTVGKRVAAVRA